MKGLIVSSANACFRLCKCTAALRFNSERHLSEIDWPRLVQAAGTTR